MNVRLKKIVLATNNVGKLRELRASLVDSDLEFRSQAEYDVPEAKETGVTFIENALIKARNASRHSGLPSISDDSGLEVDCLNGAPGVHSSRFAGENATDSDNLDKLLDAVAGFPLEKRTARFHCVMAYLRSEADPAPLISTGIWEGHIGMERKGHHGFGYDPVFIVANIDQTSAELEVMEKSLLSHRGQAIRKLIDQLRTKY